MFEFMRMIKKHNERNNCHFGYSFLIYYSKEMKVHLRLNYSQQWFRAVMQYNATVLFLSSFTILISITIICILLNRHRKIVFNSINTSNVNMACVIEIYIEHI